MKLKNNNVDVNSTVDVKKDIELDDDFLFNEIKNNLNKNAKEFLTKYFNNKITNMILLILSNENISNIEMTVDQMCDKIYKFLISVQIYDNTPFLIPQYGSSEFTQAMSRLSAVNGSIFLINDLLECDIKYNKENTDDKNKGKFIIEVNDGEKNEKFLLNVDRIFNFIIDKLDYLFLNTFFWFSFFFGFIGFLFSFISFFVGFGLFNIGFLFFVT